MKQGEPDTGLVLSRRARTQIDGWEDGPRCG